MTAGIDAPVQDSPVETHQGLEGVTLLPGMDAPVEVRMGPNPLTDWRELLAHPERNPSRTDYIFRKYVYEHFYRQHPEALFRALGSNAKAGRVLDLGCGDVFGGENWIDRIGEYHGLDASAQQLRLARHYLPAAKYPNVHLYYGPINTEHFPPNFADFVISSEVIEHLDDPWDHLRRVRELVKPGGYVSLSTPCSWLYYYPSEFIPLMQTPHGRQHWVKATRCHKYWAEMLPHHPALPPRILQSRIAAEGLTVIKHWSCLFYVQTRWQLSMRLSRLLETKGWQAHLPAFRLLLKAYESLPHSGVPGLKYLGTRQFVLARKPLRCDSPARSDAPTRMFAI